MSAPKRDLVQSERPRHEKESDVHNQPADFTDPESMRTLDAMVIAVARELGRQAAREWWEDRK